jgi:hypothetical protein
MASNVSELKTVHTDQPAVKEQKVGLTMVYEFTISDGQSLQFSTFVGRDDTAEELNEIVDKMVAAGERQKNKAHLAKAKNNLIAYAREIEVATMQINEAERRHQLEKVAREAEAAELQNEINRLLENDAMAFAADNAKRGQYKPSQAVNVKIQPLRAQIARLDADQDEQDRVRADTIKQSEDVIRSHRSNMEWNERQIVHLEAALKG